MTRRDLNFIHAGVKVNYDAWPHDRAVLTNLRDIAVTDADFDRVAAAADEFDAEDRAFIEARRQIQRIKQKDPQ